MSVDFLIVGSGIAGLRAAIALAPHGRVLMLTKSVPGAGSTGYAQGGIAAALAPDDSPERHAADTIAAGAGLCDPRAVAVLTVDGQTFVRELLEWGAGFDRRPDGALDFAHEGAHSTRRVLHTRDATGREIGRTLATRIAGHPAVAVHDHATVAGLIVRDGRVAGVRFLDRSGAWNEVFGRATLLATGGAGQIYRETTNPEVASGDGISVAWLAGARVVDLEFVQFHPTALAVPGAPRFLLSEALRGEGARLVNVAGEAFMAGYDSAGDLAPRDRVARAILREAERTGAPVSLSLQHLPSDVVRARFPGIAAMCASVGLDLAADLLPVSPAAHYFMGGVETDLDGRTSVPGLFAAGEVACTGVHGANRLASNSLLEGLVFGGRAGEAMAGWRGQSWPVGAPRTASRPAASPLAGTIALDESLVRETMWQHAGVFRDASGLRDAVNALDAWWASAAPAIDAGPGLTAHAWRAISLAIVGRLVARAALRREESRGAHARTDYPETDDLHWLRRATDVRDD